MTSRNTHHNRCDSFFFREKFVEFHDLRAAEAAQQSLNEMDFNGVKLEVQYANTQSKTV